MAAEEGKPYAPRGDHAARKAYRRWHYQANKAAYVARAKAKTAEMRTAAKAFMLEHLRAHPCVDCGETDPIVLEFDHRPGEGKSFNLADAAKKGIGLARLRAEIARCDVRCANCHRRATYRRSGRTHREG